MIHEAEMRTSTKEGSSIHVAQKTLEGTYAHLVNLRSNVSRVATTSGQRIKIRKAMNVLSKKARKLMQFFSKKSNYKISEENFESGHFPWQNLRSNESDRDPNQKAKSKKFYLLIYGGILTRLFFCYSHFSREISDDR